jgi:phosphonate transport system substrate-binding protein
MLYFTQKFFSVHGHSIVRRGDMVGYRNSLGVVLVCVFFLIACSGKEAPRKISLEKRQETAGQAGPQVKHLRIAVGGMITPKAGYGYYRQFLDYIGEKVGMHVEYVDRESYAEINALVRSGDVDIAFVCGGPYVEGHDAFGMELLAAPQAYGRTVYYTYVITRKDSPITGFAGLRGKRFAFTDPLSNSGKLVPTYMLAKMHETPDSFFKQYIFTHAHDKSIKAVAQGIVDGAAVDSLIWEYENRTNPEFTSKTKIITKSPPYGIPPVVVRRGLDGQLKEKIRQVILNAHLDSKGKEILTGMMIDKFVPIEDSAYNSIREMGKWIVEQRGKKSK